MAGRRTQLMLQYYLRLLLPFKNVLPIIFERTKLRPVCISCLNRSRPALMRTAHAWCHFAAIKPPPIAMDFKKARNCKFSCVFRVCETEHKYFYLGVASHASALHRCFNIFTVLSRFVYGANFTFTFDFHHSWLGTSAGITGFVFTNELVWKCCLAAGLHLSEIHNDGAFPFAKAYQFWAYPSLN